MNTEAIKMKKNVEDCTLERVDMIVSDSSSWPSSVPQFSGEIYEMIFSYLDASKDLMAVSNSSEQFRQILKPGKAVWLFAQIFPLVCKTLEAQAILNCRLVCKQWTKSVDNFLHAVPTTRQETLYPFQNAIQDTQNMSPAQVKAILRNHPPHSVEYQSSLLNKGFIAFHPAGKSTLSFFLDDMQNHNHRNPFVFRFVHLSNEHVEYPREIRNHWNTIVHSLLAQFGHHIWRAIITPTIPNDLIFSYEQLRKSLLRMPNLKTLSVCGFTNYDSFYTPDKSTQLLQDYIARNPLPELEHLHTIKELLCMKQAPVISELMKRYSSHLRKLDISLSIWNKEAPYFRNMPQLTDLDLCMDVSRQEWQQFCRVTHAPNLGKLSLYVKEAMTMTQILKNIHPPHFPSLHYLKLKFSFKPRDYRSIRPAQFLLENVKTLEVVESPNVPYDQLLKHLPRLEYMLVCYEPIHRREFSLDDGIFEIRKCMYSGNMYESNIWTKISSLKEFTFARLGDFDNAKDEIVSRKQYTRDMYDYLRTRNNAVVERIAENENLENY